METNKKRAYEQILLRFVGDNEFAPWTSDIFAIGDKNASTNGKTLVTTPKYMGCSDRSEKVKSIYPIKKEYKKTIGLSELKQALSKCPMVDCFDEIEECCEACDRDGEVKANYYYGGRTFIVHAKCPICGGDGVITKASKTPNGKKKLDYNKCVKIDSQYIGISFVEDMIFVAEKLSKSKINIHPTNTKRPSYFSTIGEVEMIGACLLKHTELENKTVFEIKTKD